MHEKVNDMNSLSERKKCEEEEPLYCIDIARKKSCLAKKERHETQIK